MSKKNPVAKSIVLRGDSHPTHSGLINMLEHAICLIEEGRIDEGRKLIELAARPSETPMCTPTIGGA